MRLWLENPQGSLVKIGGVTEPKYGGIFLCVSQADMRNVCREALINGRVYLNDEEKVVIE